MAEPNERDIFRAACGACRSLSNCRNFFNFDFSDSWLGWENWLTVEIVRRLDHASVIRFGKYPGSRERSDILVQGSSSVAVEIKVNFVDSKEIQEWKAAAAYALPNRVANDLRKLNRLGRRMNKLLLFAVAFESPKDHAAYRRLLATYLSSSCKAWSQRWRKCDSFLLVSLSR